MYRKYPPLGLKRIIDKLCTVGIKVGGRENGRRIALSRLPRENSSSLGEYFVHYVTENASFSKESFHISAVLLGERYYLSEQHSTNSKREPDSDFGSLPCSRSSEVDKRLYRRAIRRGEEMARRQDVDLLVDETFYAPKRQRMRKSGVIWTTDNE